MSDDRRTIDSLRNRVTNLEAENDALRLEADDLDRQVAELEAEVASLSHANLELEAELIHDSDEERLYLASKNRRHFHRPRCKWVTYIPDHLLIEFGSHAEAVEAQYKPCKTCRA